MCYSRLTHWLVILSLLVPTPLLAVDWIKASVPFDATAISRTGKTVWVCGPNAAIASSSDGGLHWDVRNLKGSAGTLLSIRWANERLGVTGGTGGLLLLSSDGGKDWQQVPTSSTDPILDMSFADAEHGVIVTTASVMYTSNGGQNWQRVLPSTSGELGRFRFVLEVAALDANHAAVLVKEGPAQYYDGRLLTTSDGGTSWKTSEIQHTTLNNLLIARGEYWLVGTEVIDRENHGGHAVAITLHSTDATNWTRGPKPPIDTNYACRPEGCLMWNGAWFDPFTGGAKTYTFPKARNLTTQWSATGGRICALVPDLQCADATFVNTLPQRGSPAPQLAASELRPTTSELAGKCIRCDYPRILVSEEYEGNTMVRLSVLAQPDGSVSAVEILNAPNADVGATLAHAARGWIFYPDLSRPEAAPVKRTVSLPVTVVKSK